MLTIGPPGLDTVARADIASLDGRLDNLEPGGTTGWADVTAAISTAGIPGVSPPTPELFAGSSIRKEYAFAVNDYVFLEPFHTNHDLKPGGFWYVHVHWSSNGTNVQPVKWEFQIQRARGHNQANFAAPVSYFVTQTPHGTAWRHMVAEVGDADRLTVLEPDELILVTLRRLTNGGTDNTDQVFGLTVDFHYQTDRGATPNKAPNFYA